MAVAHVTIGSLHIPPDSLGYVRVQLIPFYFVKDFMTVQQMGNWFLLNALKLSFYNVLLLMPLGFYLGFLFEVKRKASAILLVFLTSLLIETVQWILSAAGVIWSRTFNVDDLLLNTIGGLIGYVVFKIVQKVSSRKKVRKISNNERISGLNSSL
jgi:glycopeptide antibiotics resistance protein